MTEQPDTVAIRAEFKTPQLDMVPSWVAHRVLTLCNALDAARAQRDHSIKAHAICCDERIEAADRAEAAEAELTDSALMRRRAVEGKLAAEARIANALVYLNGHGQDDSHKNYMATLALTGGTE